MRIWELFILSRVESFSSSAEGFSFGLLLIHPSYLAERTRVHAGTGTQVLLLLLLLPDRVDSHCLVNNQHTEACG